MARGRCPWGRGGWGRGEGRGRGRWGRVRLIWRRHMRSWKKKFRRLSRSCISQLVRMRVRVRCSRVASSIG